MVKIRCRVINCLQRFFMRTVEELRTKKRTIENTDFDISKQVRDFEDFGSMKNAMQKQKNSYCKKMAHVPEPARK